MTLEPSTAETARPRMESDSTGIIPAIEGAQAPSNSAELSLEGQDEASDTDVKPIHCDIPKEVIAAIVTQSRDKDLPAWMRVDHRSYSVAVRLLYTNLLIDLSHPRNPLFTVTYSGACHWNQRGESIGDNTFGRSLDPDYDYGEFEVIPVETGASIQKHEHRFTHTKHLTISRHYHYICHQYPPLIMPNLLSLRVCQGTPEMESHEQALDVCRCEHYTRPDPPPYHVVVPQCTNTPPCHCPLLAQLDPPKIILGGPMTGLAGLAQGLRHTSFPFPSPNLKELVILAGSHTGTPSTEDYSSFANLPSTIEKLQIVVGIEERLIGASWANGESTVELRQDQCGYEGVMLVQASDKLSLLGKAAIGSTREVEIVGVEAVRHPRGAYLVPGICSQKDCADRVRKGFVEGLVARTGNVQDAEERAQRIKFSSYLGIKPENPARMLPVSFYRLADDPLPQLELLSFRSCGITTYYKDHVETALTSCRAMHAWSERQDEIFNNFKRDKGTSIPSEEEKERFFEALAENDRGAGDLKANFDFAIQAMISGRIGIEYGTVPC